MTWNYRVIAETLIYQADAAMYLAKEAGKNNYQFSVNIKLGNKSKMIARKNRVSYQ
ncbi:MAG: hypothetical protein HW406_40 [Candidatus Brocadiaceae bacterium]|nr:hypothetical protein [Candidatus Brocadiaceae bacterium]